MNQEYSIDTNTSSDSFLRSNHAGLLLYIVHELEPVNKDTWIHLLQYRIQDQNQMDPYTFVPGTYGPYSHGIRSKLTKLVQSNFIKVHYSEKTIYYNGRIISSSVNKTYTTTDKGRKVIKNANCEDSSIENIISYWSSKKLPNVLWDFASEYPNLFKDTSPFSR